MCNNCVIISTARAISKRTHSSQSEFLTKTNNGQKWTLTNVDKGKTARKSHTALCAYISHGNCVRPALTDMHITYILYNRICVPTLFACIHLFTFCPHNRLAFISLFSYRSRQLPLGATAILFIHSKYSQYQIKRVDCYSQWAKWQSHSDNISLMTLRIF